MLKCPVDEKELNWLLSEPAPALIEMMKRLEGDIAILGVAGKMGITMAMQAKRAVDAAKVDKKIIGIARFSNPEERQKDRQPYSFRSYRWAVREKARGTQRPP